MQKSLALIYQRCDRSISSILYVFFLTKCILLLGTSAAILFIKKKPKELMQIYLDLGLPLEAKKMCCLDNYMFTVRHRVGFLFLLFLYP